MGRSRRKLSEELEEAFRRFEHAARRMAARIIRENPNWPEIEVSTAFIREWDGFAEKLGRALLSAGEVEVFHVVYSRLLKIGSHVLAELNGSSQEELRVLAERWDRPYDGEEADDTRVAQQSSSPVSEDSSAREDEDGAAAKK